MFSNSGSRPGNRLTPRPSMGGIIGLIIMMVNKMFLIENILSLCKYSIVALETNRHRAVDPLQSAGVSEAKASATGPIRIHGRPFGAHRRTGGPQGLRPCLRLGRRTGPDRVHGVQYGAAVGGSRIPRLRKVPRLQPHDERPSGRRPHQGAARDAHGAIWSPWPGAGN